MRTIKSTFAGSASMDDPQHFSNPTTPYNTNPPSSFNLHQASPHTALGSTAAAGVPGALQPAGGVRPVQTAPYGSTTVPSMPMAPLHTNAQQYSQTPSRTNTLHSHSRSSPGGMADSPQKYIPFNQTPTQTPVTSNPKAYNLSHTHTPAGPSHSPLNLTDIRSRAISDANETGTGVGTLLSYSDTPTNSNYLAPFATYAYDWCKWPVHGGNSAGKMAVGSYLEDTHNFVRLPFRRLASRR